jgi:hypothetical protein
MKDRWFGFMTVLAGVLMAGTVQAMLYQDNFDNDGLGGNSLGVGGGGANQVLDAGQAWQDNGDLWLGDNAGTGGGNYEDSTLFYSTNAFQSATGLKLGVVYTDISRGTGAAGNRFGFGLISDDTDLSTLTGTGLNLFGNGAGYYSLGVNVTGVGGTEGLNFSDGTTATNLNAATLPAGVPTSVIIEIDPGGAWSYSIGGVLQASGTIAGGFDLTKNYHVAVYSQDDQSIKSVQAIMLNQGEDMPPAAFEQAFTMLPDADLDITLAGIDLEGNDVSYNVTAPSNGTLAGTAPNLTYTPNAGYEGADSFTFTVNDGLVDSPLATVSISVTNVPPVANSKSVQVLPDTLTAITLTASDSDGPSALVYTLETTPAHGALGGTAPNLTYLPNAGYTGPDSISFTVFDGLASSATGTVSITVTNYPPVANSQNVSTAFETAVAITLSSTDAEGSNLTYSVTNPSSGTLSGTAPALTYTPNAGFDGSDSFTFTVNDGVQDSDPATVSITVAPGGVNLAFTALNMSTNANTLSVGGSTSNLVVTGVASGNDFVYSVTYTGADYDGDTINDTLSFDVLVEAWNGSTVSNTFIGSDTDVNAYNGSATIGSNDAAAYLGTVGWSVGNNAMNPGETLAFTVQNLIVTASKGCTASLNRFSGVSYKETGNGYGHQAVIGEGAGGLFASRFNATTYNVNGLLNEGNPLYISSSDIHGLPSSNPSNWNVLDVDFIINVQLGSVEPGNFSMEAGSGGALVFSWEGGGKFNVLTNANLVYPKWGVAVPATTSPATTTIGSEPKLFFMLSE